jgi:D-lactate dehydrogenase (cytochrome)
MPDVNLSAALDALADLLGPDRITTGEDERRRHGSDESWHPPAPPDAVVRIGSTEEAAGVVRICADHGVPIVPFGAGTSLEGHVAALKGGISVDTSEMDKILRLSIDDLDVTVQAGVTRRALDEKLRPEGVFFSVDPGADATVGGMVATGASGTTSVRYGTMRENVLSLTVVTAAGDVVKTGSRARKSSAGYDLTRLFIGSEGTLGLITEATLRVRPTPEAMTAAVCAFPRLEDAVNCTIAVLQHAIPVARIELLDELQMEAVNRHSGLAHAVAPTLFLEFHGGSQREVSEQADEVGALAREYGGRDFEWAADEAERRRLWRARHRAYEASRALRPGARGFATDACVPVSRLAECILETRRDIDASGLLAPIVGHVGDGNFHLAILVDPDDADELSRAVALNDRLVRRAIDLGGTCTGEHGIGYGKAGFLELEHGPAGVALMRAIKAALDPQDLFNPGKITQAQAANFGSTSRA